MDNSHIAALGGLVLEASDALNEATVQVAAENLIEVLSQLKSRGFNRLSAVSGVDWYPEEPRFELVYNLHALPLKGGKQERIRVKCRVSGATPEIASAVPVWEGAGWYEREIFDLLGVNFVGHPDMRRLLMPDGWVGHPLRKDFPIHGHKYDYAENK